MHRHILYFNSKKKQLTSLFSLIFIYDFSFFLIYIPNPLNLCLFNFLIIKSFFFVLKVVTPTREEREKQGAQIKEYILEDNACPLSILMKHPSNGGTIIFQIRRCTPDILAIRKAKKKVELEKQQQLQQQQQQTMQQQQPPIKQRISNGNYQAEEALNDISNTNNHIGVKSPCLIELTQEGFELQSARIIQIKSDFYEIGNDKYLASTQPNNYIRLDANMPGIEKKHCVLKKSNDGMQLFLIPLAETYINDRLAKEPTQLLNNFTIRIGKLCLFRLEMNGLPITCEQTNIETTSSSHHQLNKPTSLNLNQNNNWVSH